MSSIEELVRGQLWLLSCDCVSVGVIDFSTKKFECASFQHDRHGQNEVFYDLASLTKPLTLGLLSLAFPKLFNKELNLLINHRAGLPAWARLGRDDWEAQVLNYPIAASPVCYSDLSYLRAMLILEQAGVDIAKKCASFWDGDIVHWRKIKDYAQCVVTGVRGGVPIQGQVHDDNAFNLGRFCTHAGLFGTISGLCRSLLNFDAKFNLLEQFKSSLTGFDGHPRFINGWDTVCHPDETLAGAGASFSTFGHLGFTGTSIWIDPHKKLGHVILTNFTQNSWYDRHGLNQFRKSIGKAIWANSLS